MNLLHEDMIETLTDDECWAFLESQEIGRLAFAVAGYPDIVPVNHRVVDRKIYLRTGEGSKLVGVTVNKNVAFESDRIDGDRAVSVIVRGTARELDADTEYEFAEDLKLRTWTSTPKFHYIEITSEEISGRRFHLVRPAQ